MNLKVLFLDDDSYVLHAYQRMLRGAPYQLYFAQDKQQALDILQSTAIDLLLVDYCMPEQNGLEFCAAREFWQPSVRCYLVTGLDNQTLFATACDKGLIDGTLAKPLRKDTLLDFLQCQQQQLLTNQGDAAL
ncbi:MAG: response regulator [Alkalimonas sp.]|nr:response regulator [Alkalimonas sp.]